MLNFVTEERGAVTVDWVVLTAALVGLGLATTAVVSTGVGSLSNETADVLEDGDILQVASFGRGWDFSAFNHAIDDGLAEQVFTNYSGDGFTDADVQTALTTYHDRLAGGSATTSHVDIDTYAGIYAAAEERDIDTRDYTDPDDFAEIYHTAQS